MQYALPHPRQAIAVPLVTLALGAAGGATMVALISEDDVIRAPSANLAAESHALSQARPEEGAPVRATSFGTQTVVRSEKATDPSFVVVPRPGLSEKSTDPSFSGRNANGLRP